MGRVFISRLMIVGQVHFLVDTGATVTSLSPNDGDNLLIPVAELANPARQQGIAGTRTYYREPAVILFLDGVIRQRFDVELYIAPPDAAARYLPSLLGRDVLNTVRMDYDFPAGRLEFAVNVSQ